MWQILSPPSALDFFCKDNEKKRIPPNFPEKKCPILGQILGGFENEGYRF